VNERQADALLEQAFERLFEDEPPVVLDWAAVMGASASYVMSDRPSRPARPRRVPRRTRLALALVVLVGLLVPAAVLAARTWLVVGTRTPPALRRAIAAQLSGAPALARAYSIDPVTSRVVAEAQTSRGPLFVIAGPSLGRHVADGHGHSIAMVCGGLVFGFPPLALGDRSVVVAGARYWVDENGSCGGVAPMSTRQPGVTGGAWELIDEHLAVVFGRLAGGAAAIDVVRADGQHSAVHTRDGYFALVTADDGRPPGERVTSITLRDAHGRAVGTPFASVLAQPLPSAHPLVGTLVGNAYLLPGHVALRTTGSTNAAHARELVVAIQNSGSVSMTRTVRVVIRIGSWSYRATASPRLPGASDTVRVRLPQNLRRVTAISVKTLPLPGERNLTNNHRRWRVSFVR
jgi:hypothetical protein